MRKIFTLLTLLLTAVAAMAADFTGHRKVTIGYLDPSEMDNTSITVTDKGDGKYDVAFNNVINKDGQYEDNYGTFTFSDLTGTTADGVTTIEGKMLKGVTTSSGMGISEISGTDVLVKFNGEKAYATMDGLITMYSRDTRIKVVFGEDNISGGGSVTPGEIVVGEDGFHKDNASFGWDFAIDFNTQKFVAVVDLSTCSADNTKENVASIGTDIAEWFSGVAMGGNIHIYYTPSTKELLCWYISSNETLGAWKYSKTLSDIEGDITIDLSRQYGLRVNGEQVFDANCLTKILAQKALYFGSKEGDTRSNATYKTARVVPVEFEAEEAQLFSGNAKLLYKGAYTRTSGASAEARQTALGVYEIVLKNLTADGKTLGDVTISGVGGTPTEGDGDNSTGWTTLALANVTATLSNSGELATELGLADGAQITMKKVTGYIYGTTLPSTYTMQIGNDSIIYSFGIDEVEAKTFTNKLTTSFSGSTESYKDKTLSFKDYGDGFADITINSMQFGTMQDTDMGNLVISEVPYTKNEVGDIVFAASDLTAMLENTPTMALKNWTNVSVEGKISGSLIYLDIKGEAFTMPLETTFGEPIAESVVYTGHRNVVNDTETSDLDDQKISVRDDGDGNYTISIIDICGEDAITFPATGVTSEDGVTTYSAEKAEAPMNAGNWKGYTAYVNITTAKSQGDKFYGVFWIDCGGFAASYPYCGYLVTFGEDFTTVGIGSAKTDTTAVKEIYTVGGIRTNSLQKGVNIVRTADGNTVKVVK